MGGGKSNAKTETNLGVWSDLQASQQLQQLNALTQPLREKNVADWNQLLYGEPTKYMNTAFGALRRPIEEQYNTARENVLATVPQGGGLFDQLTNVETARAGQLSDILGKLYIDEINKAYGSAWNAPTATISGLEALGQHGITVGGQVAGGVSSMGQSLSNICCYVVCTSGSTGQLLEYVRKYKDEHYDVDSMVAQGYKRFAIWLVPSMLKYTWFKRLIKAIMVHPMEVFAKAHYENQIFLKALLYPLTRFWVLTYALIGQFYGVREWHKYWSLNQVWNKYNGRN